MIIRGIAALSASAPVSSSFLCTILPVPSLQIRRVARDPCSDLLAVLAELGEVLLGDVELLGVLL